MPKWLPFTLSKTVIVSSTLAMPRRGRVRKEIGFDKACEIDA
ncbi:hypothetical protein [Streptomyces sp. MMS24-I29]